ALALPATGWLSQRRFHSLQRAYALDTGTNAFPIGKNRAAQRVSATPKSSTASAMFFCGRQLIHKFEPAELASASGDEQLLAVNEALDKLATQNKPQAEL